MNLWVENLGEGERRIFEIERFERRKKEKDREQQEMSWKVSKARS